MSSELQTSHAIEPLHLGPVTITSRLIVGTGKYANFEIMQEALEASGAEIVTVAVRRERLVDSQGRSLLDFLDTDRYTILPNTAGCFTAEDAVRVARLGREILEQLDARVDAWVAYVGTSPQTDPCLTGQPATVYAREYARGNSLLLDDTGTGIESIFAAEGGVGVELVALDGANGGGSGGYPDLRIAITAGTTGKVTFIKPKNPDFSQKHRMSWRLLGQ